MGDSEVVAAIAAGDPAGLAEAYDRYAAPLYRFCRGMLREPADAADVVQDTFVIAAPRMSALRDPQRLRPWLYTVARNECLRRLRSSSLQAPLEEAPEVTDEAADVAADVEKAELRALVREALPGVAPAEQEVLELQLRHGLAGDEVASVLGVSRNHAHALMSRARGQLETALGVLVVARTGRRDCPELDAMLAGWDGRLTVLLRKRLNRHVERCASLLAAAGGGDDARPRSWAWRRSSRCRWRPPCPRALQGSGHARRLRELPGRGGAPGGSGADTVLVRPSRFSSAAPSAAATVVAAARGALRRRGGHRGRGRGGRHPGRRAAPHHPGGHRPGAAPRSWPAAPARRPAGTRPPATRPAPAPPARPGPASWRRPAPAVTPGAAARRTGHERGRGAHARARVIVRIGIGIGDRERHHGRDADRQPGHARRHSAGHRHDHAHRVGRPGELDGLRAARPGEEGRGRADVGHAGGRRHRHDHRHRWTAPGSRRAPDVQPRRHHRDGRYQLMLLLVGRMRRNVSAGRFDAIASHAR